MDTTFNAHEIIQDLSSDQLEELYRAALARDYWQCLHSFAEEIRDECLAGEHDSESLDTRIHETCDGSAWVIYTGRAILLLYATDNHDAYTEDFGQEGIVSDGTVNWSALAYCAMRQDLVEKLLAMEVDFSDPSPAEDEEDEGGE